MVFMNKTWLCELHVVDLGDSVCRTSQKRSRRSSLLLTAVSSRSAALRLLLLYRDANRLCSAKTGGGRSGRVNTVMREPQQDLHIKFVLVLACRSCLLPRLPVLPMPAHPLHFAESPSTALYMNLWTSLALQTHSNRAMLQSQTMHAHPLGAAQSSVLKAPCPHSLRHLNSVPRPRILVHRNRERLLSCQAASSRESSGSDFDSKAADFGRAAGKRWGLFLSLLSAWQETTSTTLHIYGRDIFFQSLQYVLVLSLNNVLSLVLSLITTSSHVQG